MGSGVFEDATTPTTLQGFDLDANHFYSDGLSVNHAHYLTPLLGALKTINNVVAHNVASTASKRQFPAPPTGLQAIVN